MAEIINVNDITNGSISNGEWAGTGIFDKLIDAVNNNLAIQLEAGRLTNSEFGSVYSNIVPAVLNSSIDFALRKRLTEVNIDGALKDNLLKDKELELSELEKLIKLYTKDTLLIDEHNQNLKVLDSATKDNLLKDKELELSDIEKIIKIYNKDFLLVDEHNQNLKSIESIDKDNLLKDKQIELLDVDKLTKTYTKDTLLIDEHNKNLKAIDSLNKEIEIKSKQLETEYINMIIKDKEAVKIGMDKAFANNNANLKDVYTPIYKEVI